MMSDLMRVAVPNKGSLSEAAAKLLSEAGYRQRSDTKDLVLIDDEQGVEFYYLRPRDIAIYVGEGTLHVGITGRDLLLDSHASAAELLGLGFGVSRFRFAAPAGSRLTIAGLAGKRIATSFPGLVGKYLDQRGIAARLIELDGAVESAIRLGVADVIADVVETGTTLRRAGLELFGEPILTSEAILIGRTSDASELPGLAGMLRRINGVLVARNYQMLDYDLPKDRIEAATAIAGGLESPTVSPLARPGWVAVRVMVPKSRTQLIMDQLWDIGARAILITDIAACRV